MDFGMPAFIGKTLEECAEHCRSLGLQFVEVSMDFPEYQPERIDVDRFAKIAENTAYITRCILREPLTHGR